MPLVLQDVTLEDFDTFAQLKHSQAGDLTAPVLFSTWPVDNVDAEAAAARNAWSVKQQREMFLDDPSVRFMKVVDTDTNEILSLARWHYYEKGYQHPEFTAWEMNGKGADADKWPEGLNSKLYKGALMPFIESRPIWQGSEPMWVLTTLVTRHGHRRRGAGGMLVEWGAKLAKKDGVPAYIEASQDGRPLYEKYGFSCVGEQSVDMTPFGVPHTITLARMKASP